MATTRSIRGHLHLSGDAAVTKTWARVAALAAVYVLAGRLGLIPRQGHAFATLVWPPTGIALAALLRYGYRIWPGVALGAVIVESWFGAPLPVALGIALGNTLEALAGAYALRHFAQFRGQFDRLRHVVGLVIFGALLSTILSATLGVLSVYLGGVISADQIAETWGTWWVGDAVGNLLVAPLLISWATARHLKISKQQLVELFALGALLVAVTADVFVGPLLGSLLEPSNVLGPTAVFPLFVWAALRFGMLGGATATAFTSVVALWATFHGSGPFVRATLDQSLLLLQTFMASAALTTMVVAITNSERIRALRAREDLLAIVSHDLRNPIGAMRMSAEALARTLPEAPASRVEKHCQLLRRSLDRMMRLIGDLLDAAAIESGNISVEVRPEDARRLVEEAVDTLLPLAIAGKVNLRMESGDDFQLACDRARILQVLSNLIGNAIKFSTEGGTISVRVERVGNEARLSVEDEGVGIERSQLRHVFDRYWHAGTQAGGGTGLGLAIAKGIVEAHGGTIWARSSVGAGSTFYFTLPLSGPGVNRRVGEAADEHGEWSVSTAAGERELFRRKAADAESLAIAESANDAIVSTDAGGNVRSWNRATEAFFGYDGAELRGMPLTDLMPQRYRGAYRQRFDRVRGNESRFTGRTLEVHGLRRNGTEFPCEISVSESRSAEGATFTGIIRDITERLRVESTQRERERQFRLMIEAVNDYAIFMLDTKGYVVTWNAGAQSINGYLPEKIVGKHFSVLYSADDRERGKPEQELEAARTQGKFEESGWRIRKGGSRFWANVVISAMRDERGELRGFAKVTRDLTAHSWTHENR